MYSSIASELFWNAMAQVMRPYSDQWKLNYALANHMNVTGRKMKHGAWHGPGNSGLTVTILSMDDVCRKTECPSTNAGKYYIWHKGGGSGYANRANVWYLRKDWMNAMKENTEMIGYEWLKSIAK